MCLFGWCRATRLYTVMDYISHLLLIWELMAFPSDVVPMHNVLFRCSLGPFVKCLDLSLLGSLAQILYPSQCSHVWRGSLSPAIILQVIPFLNCLKHSKQDTSDFQILWQLMQPLRSMLTYVCRCICLKKRTKRTRWHNGLQHNQITQLSSVRFDSPFYANVLCWKSALWPNVMCLSKAAIAVSKGLTTALHSS